MTTTLEPPVIVPDLRSPMQNIWTSVASVSAARAYSLVVSAAMIMIVARWLGPAGQGIMAASTAWGTLFATLGALSLGQVAIHRATIRRGEVWLGETMGTLLVFDGIVTLACWLAAALIYLLNGGRMFGSIPPAALVVAFLIVPFIVWEFYGGSLLTATNRIAVYNRAQLIGRTVGISLMLICWFLRLGVVAAIGIAVFSQAVVSLTGLRDLWRAAEGRVRATLRETRALLHGAAQLHVNTVSTYILTSLGVLIVNRYCKPAETGWYQFAMSLINVILVIPTAASLVLSARVAQVGPEQGWVSQRKIFLYLPLLMIGGGIFAAIAAPTAIPLVVGAKYLPAVPLFQLSLFGVFGMTIAAVMASQWIGRGYFWQMSASSIVVAGIHLTVTLFLVRRHGMYGAVYANIITSVIAIIGNGTLAVLCEMQYRRALAK
jgi:O-antigen/teichoic acid export membrane protein